VVFDANQALQRMRDDDFVHTTPFFVQTGDASTLPPAIIGLPPAIRRPPPVISELLPAIRRGSSRRLAGRVAT